MSDKKPDFSAIIASYIDLSQFGEVFSKLVNSEICAGRHYIRNFYEKTSVLHSSKGESEAARNFSAIATSLNVQIKRPVTEAQKGNLVVPCVFDISPIEFWDTLDDEVFKEFWIIANNKEIHTLIKSHVLLVLWESRSLLKGIDNFPVKTIDIGKTLIISLCETTKYFFNLSKTNPLSIGLSSSEYFELGVHLGTLLSCYEEVDKFINDFSSRAKKIMEPAPHWHLRFLKLERYFLKSKVIKKVGDIKEIEERHKGMEAELKELDAFLEKVKDCTHRKEVLLELVEIERFFGNQVDITEVYNRLGSLYESIAASNESEIIRNKFLMDAAGYFDRAQNYSKRDEMLNESRLSVDRAIEKKELKCISVPIELNDDHFDDFLEAFFKDTKEPYEVLLNLSGYMFAPSIHKEGDIHLGSGGLTDIIPVTPIIDNRTQKTVIKSEDPEEKKREAVMFDLNFYDVYLSKAFDKLQEEYQIQEFDFLVLASPSLVIEIDDLPFIEIGIRHFLNSEWYACSHILAPRVENIVRNVIRKCGGSISSFQGESVKEVAFGKLLKEAQEKNILPDELIYFLQACFAEDWGLNYRNKIAHGWIKPNDCSQGMCSRIVHTVLMLSRLSVK